MIVQAVLAGSRDFGTKNVPDVEHAVGSAVCQLFLYCIHFAPHLHHCLRCASPRASLLQADQRIIVVEVEGKMSSCA